MFNLARQLHTGGQAVTEVPQLVLTRIWSSILPSLALIAVLFVCGRRSQDATDQCQKQIVDHFMHVEAGATSGPYGNVQGIGSSA